MFPIPYSLKNAPDFSGAFYCYLISSVSMRFKEIM